MALPRVVPRFDPLEDRLGQLVFGLPACGVEQLTLHRRPERFDHRVVHRGGYPAHRREQAGLTQPVTKDPRRVLSAPVAVADRAWWRLASPTRHLQRVDDQFGTHVISDRPAHDHPRVHVEHSAAIHHPLACRMLSNIGDPQHVWSISDEPATHQIIMGCWRGYLPAAFASMTDPGDARQPHQPRDTFASAAHAQAEPKLGMHSWRPVGVTRHGVDLGDRGHQLPISGVAR
jgi:hypothetical protein